MNYIDYLNEHQNLMEKKMDGKQNSFNSTVVHSSPTKLSESTSDPKNHPTSAVDPSDTIQRANSTDRSSNMNENPSSSINQQIQYSYTILPYVLYNDIYFIKSYLINNKYFGMC